eukprot:CAMPEP_0202875616 /NCGR_PEP_ID=MMETSP1391-20130828/27602_1 /ASSEMBLY_ACC=CAM_ASM_000867 /TAXON_ID=1034604 /ORGANISM="Chlamydomonas leiostraca, Strain SAG 11-49" /LENGTH=87 /DNA_ID=CAMNT_0049557315 /DNA_START=275 /DNA_END=539 /DNA_ORIENTATION=+
MHLSGEYACHHTVRQVSKSLLAALTVMTLRQLGTSTSSATSTPTPVMRAPRSAGGPEGAHTQACQADVQDDAQPSQDAKEVPQGPVT